MKQKPLPSPLILNRADPRIYRAEDGTYYFTASDPGFDRIELRKADTIQGLADAEPRVVWHKHETGPLSALIWAPEIHFVRGRWYIYFAAAPNEEPDPEHGTYQHRMYAISADDPDGEWSDAVKIDSGWETFCLDATVFEHRGRLYYVWAQKDKDIRGNSNLYIAEMETPLKLKSKPVMLSKPEYDWECSVIPVNEGPALLRCGDTIYLTYSADATGAEYAMGLLTADADSDLLDPASWTKASEPVFKSIPEKHLFGPGHNSFTYTEDGRPVLVYHARTSDQITGNPLDDPGRHTFIHVLSFDREGRPIFPS